MPELKRPPLAICFRAKYLPAMCVHTKCASAMDSRTFPKARRLHQPSPTCAPIAPIAASPASPDPPAQTTRVTPTIWLSLAAKTSTGASSASPPTPPRSFSRKVSRSIIASYAPRRPPVLSGLGGQPPRQHPAPRFRPLKGHPDQLPPLEPRVVEPRPPRRLPWALERPGRLRRIRQSGAWRKTAQYFRPDPLVISALVVCKIRWQVDGRAVSSHAGKAHASAQCQFVWEGAAGLQSCGGRPRPALANPMSFAKADVDVGGRTGVQDWSPAPP